MKSDSFVYIGEYLKTVKFLGPPYIERVHDFPRHRFHVYWKKSLGIWLPLDWQLQQHIACTVIACVRRISVQNGLQFPSSSRQSLYYSHKPSLSCFRINNAPSDLKAYRPTPLSILSTRYVYISFRCTFRQKTERVQKRTVVLFLYSSISYSETFSKSCLTGGPKNHYEIYGLTKSHQHCYSVSGNISADNYTNYRKRGRVNP